MRSPLVAPESKREHLSGYQARDREVVDYHMYELQETGLQFRGPEPSFLATGGYFTCVGAAQTFGPFCDHPFPDLLSAAVGIPALNLGYGGAGPEFFARHDSLARHVNRGRFVVIQVMSGRSQSNSLFDTGGLEYLVRRSDGARMGADAAYGRLLAGPPGLGLRRLRLARRLTRIVTVPRTRRVVEETRLAWIESYRKLLSRIEVPKILFWFSKREPAYVESYQDVGSLFGEFPQLVNSEMVTEIRGLFDHYVECVTRRGSPQLLRSRFTQRPVMVDPSLDRADLRQRELWAHNAYYPSPEMHQDAAEALTPPCRQIVDNQPALGCTRDRPGSAPVSVS